jgi:hypothetical protein
MDIRRVSAPLAAAGAAFSSLLLISSIGFARGQSAQQRLKGVWVRTDHPTKTVTFVPTGANVGQIGFYDGVGVDYHFYALRGDGRIKINDLKVVATYRFDGQKLRLKIPGNALRTYVKRG